MSDIRDRIVQDRYQTSYDWVREDGLYWEVYWETLSWIDEEPCGEEETEPLIEFTYEELFLEYLAY